MEARGKRLKSLVLFGSSVYSPRSVRDVDLIVVIDNFSDILEKPSLKLEISRALRRLSPESHST